MKYSSLGVEIARRLNLSICGGCIEDGSKCPKAKCCTGCFYTILIPIPKKELAYAPRVRYSNIKGKKQIPKQTKRRRLK